MKMKFDPYVWQEEKTNAEIDAQKGHIVLRLSQACPLYITAQGVQSLVGVSAVFDIEVAEAVTFKVDAPKGVRLFRYTPPSTVTVHEGECFTNVDRMPHESGMIAEVTRARRLFEMEKRAMLAEIRKEAAIARNSVRGKEAQAETPAPAEEKPGEPAPAGDEGAAD